MKNIKTDKPIDEIERGVTMQGKTKTLKKYELVLINDPSVRACFEHGFFPLHDNIYIDEYIFSIAAIDYVAFIPEIDEKCKNIINDVVNTLIDYYEETGNLPGELIRNMAAWLAVWALDIAWCWVNPRLTRYGEPQFVQDLNQLNIPKAMVSLVSEEWVSNNIEAFMHWAYNNPGYTEKYELDIYDPLRDGYLAIMRATITDILPKI